MGYAFGSMQIGARLVPLVLVCALPCVARAAEDASTDPSESAAPSESTAPAGIPAPAAPSDPLRPGTARIAVALAGVGAMAAGTVWFFEGGEALGAGDPAAMAMGAGFLGAVGAALGGAIRALSDEEGRFDHRVTSPLVGASLGTWGTRTFGESEPADLSLRVQPRFELGHHLRLTPGLAVRADLGRTVEVDARPQGGIDPVLATSSKGLDLDWELRWFPGDGADRISGSNRVDLVVGGRADLRWERIDYLQADGARGMRRGQIVPLLLGARLNVSERQRFEVVAGPGLDSLAWSDGEGGGFAGVPPYWGALYMVSRYDIHLPHPDLLGMGMTSRLRLSYTSSHFDGLGIDSDAVIGYIGPLSLRWDTELRPSRRDHALWIGAGATLSDGGGGGALTVGMVPAWKQR